MKKTLTIVALAFLLVSGSALADTVTIISQASFSSPSGQSITSTGVLGFVGPQTITFTVAERPAT